MNVYVLCTGRCGSKTFSIACRHITNFSVGHESRVRTVGSERFASPPNHIEVDNRLFWLPGRLAEANVGKDVRYVHLVRDTRATARSFLARYNQSKGIMRAYHQGVLGDPPHNDRLDICRDYVETVNANIVHFLQGRNPEHVMTVQLESAKEDFTQFWKWIGAEGNLRRALLCWDHHYNATKPVSLDVTQQGAEHAALAESQLAG